MQKIVATLILTLIVINTVTANKEVTQQLNNIFIHYDRADYIAAEQDLVNLIQSSNPKTQYFYLIELGDLYLDKFNDYSKAESIYNLLVDLYPKDKNLSDIYYRIGITSEKQENFLKAAQMYEMVATKYRNARFATDALDAIERCFKKNYQDVVAKIDEYPITRIEFDDRISLTPSMYETPESRQKLLNDMINDRLIYEEALRRELNKTEDFKKTITDIRKNSMFQNWYQQEVINKLKITDKEKKKYYSKNKKEFVIPEQASAREILVLTKVEADSVYQLLITNQVPFESLAQEISLSPSKSSGGNLGLFRRGTHPEEIENAIFKSKANTILAPVYSETKGGYVILKVEEIQPRKERSYKEVAAEIENRLRGQMVEETFKNKTDAFRNACQVIVFETAFTENLDTVALINNNPMTQSDITEYISRIPPFYRSEFETPEGKMRILDQLILENTWLHQLEKEKYWLLNTVFSQVEESKKNNLISSLRRLEVSEKVFVSDDDISKLYKNNIADYKVPKQMRIREITLPTRELANDIRKLIVTDKLPFDSLAREHSIAPTQRMGGDLGYFSPGTKSKDIEDAAAKLKTGQVSSVIKQSDSAYTFIKLEDVKAAYTKPLDEVKPTLQRKLHAEKEQERFNLFINEIKNQYQIEKFLTEEPVPIEQNEEQLKQEE
jgi:peptidyl-prolyl cis-trans isomerase C